MATKTATKPTDLSTLSTSNLDLLHGEAIEDGDSALQSRIEAEIPRREAEKKREQNAAAYRAKREAEAEDARLRKFRADQIAQAEKYFAAALKIIPPIKPAADAMRTSLSDFEIALAAGNRCLELVGCQAASNYAAEAGLLSAYAIACAQGQAFGMGLLSEAKVTGWINAARAKLP